MLHKICTCGCGMPFNSPDRTPNRIYKKGHGRQSGHPDFVDATCANCQAPFRLHKSRIERFKAVYCSRKCASIGRTIFVTKLCFICSKPITRKAFRMKGEKVFCDAKCFAQYVPTYKTDRIEVSCDGCGQTMLAHPSKVKRNKKVFCGWECRNQHIIGTNNPSYTNGRGLYFYYGPNWKSQRRKILIRDNRTCQYCGKQPKGKRGLEVHHITPAFNFNGDYVAANDPSNLITLCVKCHKLAEKGKIVIQRYLL